MITLIGHGYVGKYIGRELKEQVGAFNWISHRDFIPTNTHFIINAAGFTGSPNVDACEKQKQATIEGNVVFPLRLEQKFACPILHISSGCVYTGYKPGGWLETDEPNFGFDNGSFYSASKNLFQELFKPYESKSYLFRIRMPFGQDSDPKNLLTKLKRYEKLVDFVNSLSYVEEVAKSAVFFALNRPETGIYNAVNPGGINTAGIIHRLGLEKEWFTQEEFLANVVAPRSNCVLNADKMQSVFKFMPAEQALDMVTNILYK